MSDNFKYEISDKAKARIHALMEQHEKGWRGIAEITDALLRANQKLNAPAPIMAIYQAVAYESGKSIVTVRGWHHMIVVFGTVLDELPCLVTITQLRLVISEANLKGEDPIAVLQRRVSEAADFGKFIPPDAYEAELNNKRPDPPDYQAYMLERVQRSLTTIVKRSNVIADEDKTRIVDFLKWLEGLQQRTPKQSKQELLGAK